MLPSFDVLRGQEAAARALFELASHTSAAAASTTFPSSCAPLPGLSAPMFLLPSLAQGNAFFPNFNFLCLSGLQQPSVFSPSSGMIPSSPLPAKQRLSVSYLLNHDDSLSSSTSNIHTPVAVKQEPVTTETTDPQPPLKAASNKRKAPSVTPNKGKRPRMETSFPSSPSSSSPPSSPPSMTSSSTATSFKGDLSLFPHLQLQLQREQLDPQQHTELVLKVWNRQQQVIKLQQLQQKKQELKAQLLQQRKSRRGSNAQSPSSPSSSSSPSSPADASSRTPSPQMPVVQSVLPTIDEILNGADALVEEGNSGSDEDNAQGKRPRRRISPRQVAVLEQVFAVEPFPGPSTKKLIAKKLGMQDRSITIWFQNKRARLKRIDGEHNSNTGGHGNEKGKREVTFHNLAVGFDGKLDMLPEDC